MQERERETAQICFPTHAEVDVISEHLLWAGLHYCTRSYLSHPRIIPLAMDRDAHEHE